MMKLTTMQQKYLLRATLILLLIAGSYLVLWSSTKNQNRKETCTESLEECCKRNNQAPSGEMIWETLSRQFFSSAGFSN